MYSVFLVLMVFAAQTLLVENKRKKEKKNKSNRVPAALLLGPLKTNLKILLWKKISNTHCEI